MAFVIENASLKERNTFGLDVKARKIIRFSGWTDLIDFVKKGNLKGKKWLAIGGGSNVVFSDNYDGIILLVEKKGIKEERLEDSIIINACSGEDWDDLVSFCVDKGYSGLENLSGIPGKVGAAPVQNIGAYGVEVQDSIYSVEYLDVEEAKVKEIFNKDCKFDYRSSIFKTKLAGKVIILSVKFKLSFSDYKPVLSYGNLKEYILANGNEITISNVRNAILEIRNSKIPDYKEKGNSGSFFKNPYVDSEKLEEIMQLYPEVPHFNISKNTFKIPAAWLIDKSGLKGKHIGGAQVYEKQPLIIFNRGNAKPKDVLELKDFIISNVSKKFGITLEPEVRIV